MTANSTEPPLTLDDLRLTISRFKAQYGTYPPEPLRISDALRERIKTASYFGGQPAPAFVLAPYEALPEEIFGFRFIVDDRVPKDEMRVYYEDANGQLQLLTLKGLT